MKRISLLFLLIAMVMVFALQAVPGPASIFNYNSTIWFDGNGNPVGIPDANIQVVVTNNDKGIVNVRAHGTLPEGSVLPSSAMHFDNANTGFVCGFGGTIEFSGVTTPSGQFSFTCKAK